MESLIVKTFDNSLQSHAQNWIDELQNNFYLKDDYQNPTLSLYTSMVYGFANHLPYSMDIEQPEYVPADFLNMIPNDVEENNWFKWDDRRTYFNAMVHWGDTFKSGMLLQMCNLFQKMILGQFPNNFVLTEDDYTSLGIDVMTKDQEYNRCFFETLKALPDWYQKLSAATDNDERRSILEAMYADIMSKISARYGSFKETDGNGNTVRESKGTISIRPSDDVSMFVHWEYITFHDGIPDVIEAIRREQMNNYNKIKQQSKISEDIQVPKLKQTF